MTVSILSRIARFKATNPTPSRSELQEFAFTFGKSPTGNCYGKARLGHIGRKIAKALPEAGGHAVSCFPMSEYPDESMTSLCVDTMEGWVAVADVWEDGSITPVEGSLHD